MGIFGGKKRIVIRKYTARTLGGVRGKYESDANKMLGKGYRVTSTVDHPRGRFYGAEMIVTYELMQS